jgi:hypothetical protein
MTETGAGPTLDALATAAERLARAALDVGATES